MTGESGVKSVFRALGPPERRFGNPVPGYPTGHRVPLGARPARAAGTPRKPLFTWLRRRPRFGKKSPNCPVNKSRPFRRMGIVPGPQGPRQRPVIPGQEKRHMETAVSTNGRYGQPGGTGLAAPRDEQNGALPERSGEPSANGTPEGPTAGGAPGAPNATGTRDARGRFTYGNPGRPRRRAPSRLTRGCLRHSSRSCESN